MARPIVHIGYHKTASTWFQRVFYRRARNYRYVNRRVVSQALLSDSALKFDAERARSILSLRPGEPVILCEEELSGYMHNGGLFGFLSQGMAGRIQATLPDARIVIFIRRQPDIIAACYQQYLRGGGTHSSHRYLHPSFYLHGTVKQPYKVPRFSFDHFEYLPLIAHYEALFGRDSVHVALYEQLSAGGRDFLREFASQLGLDIDLDEVDMAPRNASYSLPVGRLARLLSWGTAAAVDDKTHLVHIPGWHFVQRNLLELLNFSQLAGRAPSPVRLLGAREVAWIEDRYRTSNRALASHTGLPLAQHDYPLPLEPG